MVMTATNTGRVVQIIGTVLDIEFPPNHLPAVNNAVNVKRDDGTDLVTEVQQHLGNNWVRCLAMRGGSMHSAMAFSASLSSSSDSSTSSPSTRSRPSAASRVASTGTPKAIASRILMRVPPPDESGTRQR